MKNASKSKAYLWYGYLNAGERSSPVLRDDRLDTGNPKTLYLYNLARGQILEYSREIVEKKLREFKPDESGFIEEQKLLQPPPCRATKTARTSSSWMTTTTSGWMQKRPSASLSADNRQTGKRVNGVPLKGGDSTG